MKFNIFKLAIIFLLGTLLAVYTNCGKPGELMFKNGYYAGGSEASYQAFQQSVYSVTRSNCVSCHSSIQPMHASDNYRDAHDILVSQNKVNFNNISNSRLVLKLRNENHNCWSNCEDNAKEMEAAIEKWAEARSTAGSEEETATDTAIYTAETDTLEMEFTDAGNPPKSNTVKLNIEAAMLRAPMALSPGDDGAYLSVPNNGQNATLANNDANAGMAFMNFRVPVAGAYRIWGLVNGPTDQDNSFFINVKSNTANSVSGNVRNWEFTSGARFEWRMVPNINMNLVPNTDYTLELRQREDGTRVQAFVITSDTTFNGQEVGDFFGITLSFDLAPRIPGASFKVDVVDYDLYSYKLTKPRIVSPNANVKVKNIKLFLNGEYSPQHSAYTLVNKVTTSADNVLSNYAMIVIKDKGLEADRFKFSFEELYSTTNNGTTTAGTGGGDTGAQTSLMAYQATMYPISRSSAYSCVGCHMSTSPRHASDNAQTAHDATLGVVDFNTPANSRIVRKMRIERHNCGANCDNIANQFESAIVEWRTRRQ